MNTKVHTRYLILGNGWIGNRLASYLGTNVMKGYLETGGEIPVSVWKHVDVVINTIAKTNIDWCEKNKRESIQSNVMIAARLAEQCAKYNKKYVFISSACIFESKNKKDIKYEDAKPNPQCFYAETKSLAEKLVVEACPDALIPRIRLPLSEIPHPRNSITKMTGYGTLSTNQESVTIIEDMLPVLKKLIEKNARGVFHLINRGTISPAEIGKAIEYSFVTCTKKKLDIWLVKEGRAKRVTVFAGSKRIPLLSDVRKRIPSLAKNYLANSRTV